MEETTDIYRFIVKGGFDIDKNFVRETDFSGTRVTGFKLPDGRTVRLSVALEVESKDGTDYKYISSEREMAELGFEGLDYDDLTFEEVEILH